MLVFTREVGPGQPEQHGPQFFSIEVNMRQTRDAQHTFRKGFRRDETQEIGHSALLGRVESEPIQARLEDFLARALYQRCIDSTGPRTQLSQRVNSKSKNFGPTRTPDSHGGPDKLRPTHSQFAVSVDSLIWWRKATGPVGNERHAARYTP